MKTPQLTTLNRTKYCPNCQELVEIEIRGLDGFCPECNTKLYTLDTRPDKQKK